MAVPQKTTKQTTTSDPANNTPKAPLTRQTFGVSKNLSNNKWVLYTISYNPDTGDVGKPVELCSDEYRDIILERFRIEVANAEFGCDIV